MRLCEKKTENQKGRSGTETKDTHIRDERAGIARVPFVSGNQHTWKITETRVMQQRGAPVDFLFSIARERVKMPIIFTCNRWSAEQRSGEMAFFSTERQSDHYIVARDIRIYNATYQFSSSQWEFPRWAMCFSWGLRGGANTRRRWRWSELLTTCWRSKFQTSYLDARSAFIYQHIHDNALAVERLPDESAPEIAANRPINPRRSLAPSRRHPPPLFSLFPGETSHQFSRTHGSKMETEDGETRILRIKARWYSIRTSDYSGNVQACLEQTLPNDSDIIGQIDLQGFDQSHRACVSRKVKWSVVRVCDPFAQIVFDSARGTRSWN